MKYALTICAAAFCAMWRGSCEAADDNHNGEDPSSPGCDSFGGFTVIKAERLEYRTVMQALEAGHSYAS